MKQHVGMAKAESRQSEKATSLAYRQAQQATERLA